MKLFSSLRKRYAKEQLSAVQAQRLAQEIAFGPVVFQVSRLMLKFGIFRLLSDKREGLTLDEIAEATKLSRYAAQVLLEASLTIGTVLIDDERYTLAKAGWFLLNDKMAQVNMTFNHDVNYLGLFNLEEALVNGRPEGLKVFGEWPTVYEGLSSLPEQVQKSWFGFDHYYSDCSFDEALEIIFSHQPRTLLDVGGNTGRWATKCVGYNPQVEVTIMDLPQQLELMKQQTATTPGADRIHGHGVNLLDRTVPFPTGFDVIWMSQFLDCFSEEEVTSILTRAAQSMTSESRLYIMETFWDRQKFETAAYCLTQISLYFTALANGNSKMYHSEDMERCIRHAGLEIERIYDGLGQGHSIVCCKVLPARGGMTPHPPIEGEVLLQLIPQRPPVVMIDRFFGIEGGESHAGLTVSTDNLFVRDGHLQESGIIEHIAQSAAARVGYIYRQNEEAVPLGFIGSVDKLTIHCLPQARQVLYTTINIIQEVGDITLIGAKVEIDSRAADSSQAVVVVAECRMKIFLKKA